MQQLTGAIQESLLALLCYDESPSGAKVVRALVDPKAFDAYYRDLAEEAAKYLDEYGRPPGDHTLDLIDVLKHRLPDKAAIFGRLFSSLQATKDTVNSKYVLAQATAFARHQRLKTCITKALDVLQTERSSAVDEAEAALAEATKSTSSLFDPGTYLSDTRKSLSFLDLQDEAFPTGIKELDYYHLGPAPGRFYMFFAPYGRGKSWNLVSLAKQGLLNRKRVLYVTCELSEAELSQRMIQALFSVSKRSDPVEYQTFQTGEDGRFLSFNPQALRKRPSLADRDIRKFLTGRISRLKHRPPLVIKNFPMGSLTFRELEAYLDMMEATHRFIPDLLIVDYPGVMRINAKFRREELGVIGQRLKGLAQSRNIAVAAVGQANRQGEQARTVRGHHIAEDFSLLGTADTAIAYSQTEAEKELNLARLFVVKGRTDLDRFTILISQAYALGQFCLDSARMANDEYWRAVEANNGKQEETDK